MARRFSTTRWTLVRAARDTNPAEARRALASLCEPYWYPVYAFVRRGRADDEARDLTQAFFTHVIERDAFHHVREERGRFKTFLLASVRHFLANERDATRAQKRGGGQAPLSLEFDDGDRWYSIEESARWSFSTNRRAEFDSVSALWSTQDELELEGASWTTPSTPNNCAPRCPRSSRAYARAGVSR